MFDVGGGELLLILLAVIILFGPEKIPEVSRLISKGIQKMRQAQNQIQSEITNITREVNATLAEQEENKKPPQKFTEN
ncbi:twin-arginine translocase TatA/TatE family subunit [Bacteroidetes/Chlorobi group bacterium MS-B_bin-24]|jgi:TatA/E family protein of Tat protein translocase|nr:MAG: twin-arginine translocase TatA/TatE family subunit [Bacteroidetes/Chlorobi group bacterium MS-B_bin-24]